MLSFFEVLDEYAQKYPPTSWPGTSDKYVVDYL